MSSYSHSIEEVNVDLHFGNKRDANLILKSTENLILEACATVLDEFNFGFPIEDIEFSIDAIDINVKEIELDRFSHEFPKRVASEIRIFLEKSIFPPVGSVRMKKGKDGVNHESILTYCLEVYLVHGGLPKWMKRSASSLIEEFISNYPTSFSSLILSQKSNETALYRLCEIINATTYEYLIKNLTSEELGLNTRNEIDKTKVPEEVQSKVNQLITLLNAEAVRNANKNEKEVLDVISSPDQFESVKYVLIEDALNTKKSSTTSRERLRNVLSEIKPNSGTSERDNSHEQKEFEEDHSEFIEALFNKMKSEDVAINSFELIGLLKYVNREYAGLNYVISELGISEFKLLLKGMHKEFYNWYNAEEHQYLREHQLQKSERKSLFEAQVEFACGIIDLTKLELFDDQSISEKQQSSPLNQSTYILRAEEDQDTFFTILPKEGDVPPTSDIGLERLLAILNDEETSLLQTEIDERMAFFD